MLSLYVKYFWTEFKFTLVQVYIVNILREFYKYKLLVEPKPFQNNSKASFVPSIGGVLLLRTSYRMYLKLGVLFLYFNYYIKPKNIHFCKTKNSLLLVPIVELFFYANHNSASRSVFRWVK